MKYTLIALAAFFVHFSGFSQRDDHSKYFVKFSPTQLIVGEMNFAFEHRVAPQSSLEVSFGPTVSEIGINKIYFDNVLNNNNAIYGLNSRTQSGLGFFLGLSYRYYPISGASTAPRGLYLGPEIKYRMYNTYYIDNLGVLENRTGSANQLLFRFHTGYQFVIGKKFAIDVFTALGLGYTVINAYYDIQLYNSQTGGFTTSWYSKTRNRVFVSGSVGVKFGLGGNRKE